MSLEALDGPSKQGKITVSDSAVVEVKVGSDVFEDRKVITMQGDGKFYIYFADEDEVPTVTDVQNNGLTQFRNAKETYEAGMEQKLYLLAVSGNVNVVIVERA